MLGNWIRMTTTTTGTGSLTLSAVTGYPTFNDVFGNGATYSPPFYYVILNDSDGTPIEEGIGRLSASTTLVREKVLSTYVSGTLDQTSPAAATLASGTKRVICSMTAHAAGASAIPLVDDLDATTDRYISTAHMVGGGEQTQGISNNRLHLYPFLLNYAGEVDALGVSVTTQGGGSAECNIGLFAAQASSFETGALVVESGVLSCTTTGMKVGTFSARRLPPGWYMTALQTNDGSIVFLSGAIDSCLPHPWGKVSMSTNFYAYQGRTYTTTQPADLNNPGLSCVYDNNSKQITICLRAV